MTEMVKKEGIQASCISLLTDIIYQRDVVEGNPPITKFSQLRSIIVDKDNRLDSLFNEIEADACLYGKEK